MSKYLRNIIKLNFFIGIILLLVILTRPLYPEKYKDKLPPLWLGIIILLFIISFGVYLHFRYKDKRRIKKFDITFKEMEKYKLVRIDNAALLTWSAIFAFLYGIYGYYNNINHIRMVITISIVGIILVIIQYHKYYIFKLLNYFKN